MTVKRIAAGIELRFDPSDEETAERVEKACARSVSVIGDAWGLPAPKRCSVYVMTGPSRGVLEGLPWPWRAAMVLLLPLWFFRVKRVWRFAGGWTFRHRGRPAIGVKPPRLLAVTDRSIGEMIFDHEPDMGRKLEHIVCHELAHAYTAHLKLPAWLNEGIAMHTVDRYFGVRTVRADTLRAKTRPAQKRRNAEYRHLPYLPNEEVAYLYTRGYWITGYLLATHPEVLEKLLAGKRSRRSVEQLVSSSLGLSRREWRDHIDDIVAAHFDGGSGPRTG